MALCSSVLQTRKGEFHNIEKMLRAGCQREVIVDFLKDFY